MKDTGKTIHGVKVYSDPECPPDTLYMLNNDFKNEQPPRRSGTLTNVDQLTQSEKLEALGEYRLSDDLKRQYATVTNQRLWDEINEEKPKWYDDWNLEYNTPDSYGMCYIKISIPHSATEKKVFRVRCSPDSQVRELVMLLDCALTELTDRDTRNYDVTITREAYDKLMAELSELRMNAALHHRSDKK